MGFVVAAPTCVSRFKAKSLAAAQRSEAAYSCLANPDMSRMRAMITIFFGTERLTIDERVAAMREKVDPTGISSP